MEPADAAEMIGEVSEEHETKAHRDADTRFRNRAALLIALIAAVLAIGGLGGGNATDDMIYNNVKASDTWAFFQAKNMRQTVLEVAIVELEGDLADPTLTAEHRARIEHQLAEHHATIARYESEPDPTAPNDPLRGEGKRQLRAQAQAYEAAREVASDRDNNFDLAEVFLQLALVLGSVAILALNRMVLFVAIGLGVLGSVLVANGFFLLFALPM